MMVLVPQKQGLLPVLVIDLTDQTDLDEHDIIIIQELEYGLGGLPESLR